MTLQELKQAFLIELDGLYPKEEILSFFHILVQDQLNLGKIEVALNPNKEISTTVVDFFKNSLSELKAYKPIQYITGKTEFYGILFQVNEQVLIPRPETEELVDWILNDSKSERLTVKSSETEGAQRVKKTHQPTTKSQQPVTILDIGTGSGCIAVSLAKHIPEAKVYALDISKGALATAYQNAKENQVITECVQGDILNPDSLSTLKNMRFDCIVSNPPYVRHLEKTEIKKNVLEYEPHTALFVDDQNPLLFYKAIADFAMEHLTHHGVLYLEINQYLGKETLAMLQGKGFQNIELRKDLFGNDRMIKATY